MIKRYSILNSQEKYSGKLSLIQLDAVENFYWSIKIILQHIGITLLKEKIKIIEEDTRNYFTCTEKGAGARMYMGDTGFVVLKDSIIIKQQTPSLSKQNKKVSDLREQLKRENILTEQGDKLMLLINQEFSSATGAGEFVTGGHYSGFDIWKKEESPEITLGQFLKSESSKNEESSDNT